MKVPIFNEDASDVTPNNKNLCILPLPNTGTAFKFLIIQIAGEFGLVKTNQNLSWKQGMLDVVTIQPNGAPQLSVIWLHGLGADAHDFEPIVPHLNIPANFSVRFVFPNAPVQPVTINMGMSMRAWYDIISPVIGAGPEDADGIRQSSLELEKLIEHEIAQGMNSDQIVLAGFSQGGAVALFTGLRYPKRLSGILALSTYLPLQKSRD